MIIKLMAEHNSVFSMNHTAYHRKMKKRGIEIRLRVLLSVDESYACNLSWHRITGYLKNISKSGIGITGRDKIVDIKRK